jgi:adenylate cyclase
MTSAIERDGELAEPVEAVEAVDPVEALVALGVPRDAAVTAVEQDRVPFALVEQVVEAGRRYTAAEVAELSGVPLEILRLRDRALGLPIRDDYRSVELEEARLLGALLNVIPAERLLQGLRGDGQAFERLAISHLQMMQDEFLRPVREAGGDDVAVALALAEAARTLLPIAGPLVGTAYRRVLEHQLLSELVAATARGTDDQVELAVGFADVVGYTSLSARIDPAGLDEVVEAFETRCYTVAGASDRVSLVKFLGDAAMFVAVSPVDLGHALLDLVEPPEPDGPLAASPMRAGMAAGPVLVRSGDYFGGPVNLAARLTDRARGGRVLVDEDLEPQLTEDFHLRRAGWMLLRGVGRRAPLSLLRPT